ncbi:MAG: DUF4838 domain-containing protein [bacterium]
MKRYCLSILLLILTTFFCQIISADANLILVKNGKAKSTIVISAQPSDQAAQAAQILQEYIEKISGAKLPVVNEKEKARGHRILIGYSQAVRDLGVEIPSGFTYQMNEEGFVIKTVGNDIVLAGNEDWNYRGTIFAVYEFLEELGCRWFFPGLYGEVLPSKDTISVTSMDRVERPDFRFRNLWYSGWFPTNEQDQKWLRRWYDQNKLASLKMSLPGDGSITRLAPPDEYFESHPHIFALNEEGERVKDMLCLSEPETIEIAVKTILETFRNDPDALTFGFAPPDGFPMCHCKQCQKDIPGFTGKGYGDPSLSDAWFRFANKIAEEVYKEFPHRWLLTNGYANRVRPPEGIEKFSPNLGIQSAIIAACSIHRIGDPKCWQRKLYKQILNRWTDMLDCVFIYDYDPGNSLENLPFPALHNLKYDIPYFKQRGIWGFWTEGTNTWMVTHLNYYVRAKLMWDAETDVDALVRDYCEKFYGDAADAVEEYIWTLEDAVDKTTTHETWGRLMQWKVILPPVQRKMDALIEESEKRAQHPDTKQHVHVLRLVHDQMNAYVAMEQAVACGEFQKGVEWADTMLEFRDEFAEIQSGLLPYTPDWVKEFRTSLEWHKTMYQGLADRAGGEKGELITLLPRRWEFKTDPEDKGVVYQWYLPESEEPWDTLDTTLYWEAQGYQDEQGWGYWGKAWYKTGFHVPTEAEGKPLWLTIGAVYNEGVWIWVNGTLMQFEKTAHWRLGHHDVRTPIDIDLTDWIRPGEINHVAVLVNTPSPGRNPRGGLHRRSFLWSPK